MLFQKGIFPVVAVACFGAGPPSLALAAPLVEVDLLGFSFHLDRDRAYPMAPRGMDRYGQTVFNPGLGLGFDFKESLSDSGFSPLAKAGLFQDCDDRSIAYAGAGLRYSTAFWQRFLIGGSASLFLTNGENWSTAQRRFILIPFPSLELGAVLWEGAAARLGISYAPKNSAISALSGTDLLFFASSVSFSLGQ